MSSDDDDFEMLSELGEDADNTNSQMSQSENEEDEESGNDSDRELQIAFKKGLLKPGLNYAVDAPKPAANDVDAMKSKLAELKQSVKFPERLDLIPSKAQLIATSKKQAKSKKANKEPTSANAPASLEVEDVDDDFKREMAFTNLAQLAVLEVIPRLHAMGIPTRRPEDYFAQMAKSDSHMQRIREKLVKKKAEVEVRNRARQLRQMKKESKYIQEEVLKRRQAEKKLLNETAKKYSRDAKSKEDLEEMLSNGKKKTGPQTKKKQPVKVSKRREWKNTKFGYGGQKKRSKWNTAESVDDLQSHKRKSNVPFARVNRNKPGAGKKIQKNRPSKNARAQARGKAGGGRKR